MCRHPGLAVSILCMLAFLVPVARGETPPAAETPQDERLLKGAGAGTDGAGLLKFFLKRVPTEEDRRRADELVGRLGSKTFRQREQASKDLMKLGLAARPALARAAKDKDAETARRAQNCLDAIDRATSIEVEAAAVRLLKVRRPKGACRVLLDFLPSVRDAGVEEEALTALIVLGVHGGKPDDALVRSLGDREPSRRAAAALVLGHSGPDALRAKVRELLKTETDARVRLRGAQGLLAGRDKRAVPMLLALLSDGPDEIAREASDLLSGLAGDKAPAESPEGTEGRKKSRAAWDAWWKANEDKLDLAKAEADLLWQSTNQRARAVVMQFHNALMKGDQKLLLRSIDVPFSLTGGRPMTTRRELDHLFDLGRNPNWPKMEFTTPQMMNLDEYLKSPGGQQMTEFIGGLPRSEIRVVVASARLGPHNGKTSVEKAAYVVRVRGRRAHIIGIGDDPYVTP